MSRFKIKKAMYWTKFMGKCKQSFLSYTYQTPFTQFSSYFREKILQWTQKPHEPYHYFPLFLLTKHSSTNFFSLFIYFFFFILPKSIFNRFCIRIGQLKFGEFGHYSCSYQFRIHRFFFWLMNSSPSSLMDYCLFFKSFFSIIIIRC